MLIRQRIFLKTMGAAAVTTVGLPAILRTETLTPLTEPKELNMEIKRVGSQPSSKGPADWFTERKWPPGEADQIWPLVHVPIGAFQ